MSPRTRAFARTWGRWCVLASIIGTTDCSRAVQVLGDDDDAGGPDAAGDVDPTTDAQNTGDSGSDGGPFDDRWGCSVTSPVALQDGTMDRAWAGRGPQGELAAVGVQGSGASASVTFQRYDLAGRSVGSAVQVGEGVSRDGPARRVAAVWTGSAYAVVWPNFDTRGGADGVSFQFLRLDATGSTLTKTTFKPTAIVATASETQVVWTGATHLVLWQDTFRSVHVNVVDTLGAPVGADRTLGIESSRGLSVAWNGTNLGLLYARDRDVLFVRLSEQGSIIGTPVTVATVSHAASTPEIVWLGDRYAGAVVDDEAERGTVQLFVFGADGAPQGATHTIGPATAPSYDKGEHPIALAYDGDRVSIAFSDARDGLANEIYFAMASTSGDRVGSDRRVTVTSTVSGGRSEQPALVPTAKGGVVVYRTYAPGSGFVTMMRSPCP